MQQRKTPAAPQAIGRRNREYIANRYSIITACFERFKFLIFDPAALPIVTAFILLAELVLNTFVIWKVQYTEIDWIAYMQECEGFLNGTTNYAELKGDTGPLVYPAVFVYVYSALYYITTRGQNIRLAQYCFLGIYLLQSWLVLRLYAKSRKVPPYVLVICAFTSYRIHSIYVLRLFNDPIAVVFLYAALNLFLDRHWTWGSICFSLGVGVKMNILLYAPALLLFYVINLGYMKTCLQLAVCAMVQLQMGAHFLFTYPIEYIKASFDFGRIFEHKWTVNYRFLPRAFFENKQFHLALLVVHLALLVLFSKPTIKYFKNYVRLRAVQSQLEPQIERKNRELRENSVKKSKKSKKIPEEKLTPDQEEFLKSFEKGLQDSAGLKTAPKPMEPQAKKAPADEEVYIHFDQCTQLALLPFFVCNFIGIICARSLHYQFYVWYFHSLPYLAWSNNFSLGARCLLLGLIELCWNTYPSTNYSSAILHLCHIILLYGVARNIFKASDTSAAIRSEHQKQEALKKDNGNSTNVPKRKEN